MLQNFLRKCRAFILFSGPQKGPAEGGHVKKCQKSSKISKIFSTLFAQGNKRQKAAESVKKFFDTFRRFSRGTSFPALLGCSDLWVRKKPAKLYLPNSPQNFPPRTQTKLTDELLQEHREKPLRRKKLDEKLDMKPKLSGTQSTVAGVRLQPALLS